MSVGQIRKEGRTEVVVRDGGVEVVNLLVFTS
jgi:hypothetical protein